MDDITAGAGYAVLGFWLFIGIVVAAGIWDTIRKRDAQHETLRRIIESGQQIDEELAEKVLELSSDNQDLEENLKVAATIMFFISPGLILFGWIMGLFLAEELFGIMLAVGALVAVIALGLLAAGWVIRRGGQGS